MRWENLTFVALLGAAVVSASSEDAHACGGTFCDSGPTAMPVDQSGENVLFVMEGNTVEAHVQIQYQGVAERFAWVVPMQAIPEVTVGSQLLFQGLLQGTVPTFGYTQTTDVCSDQRNAGSFSSGGASSGGGGGAKDAGAGPSVVYQKTVGAFEVTVLQGGTAQEVADWLDTNQYQTVPNAAALLEDYVSKNYVFAAIKLTGGAGVNEIHPLVFKYQGNEPCVPLKLTAVAATEDMGVRTFFLGDDRVVPLNYKHIELNPVRIDWQNYASNYTQVVSRGADTPVANGQAFTTEYAGASSVVSTGTFYSPYWNYHAFEALDPELVIGELQNQGLLQCYGYCYFNHPLIESLLNEYLPVPTGLDESAFYSDLTSYKDQIDVTAWDPAAFALDFKDRIQDPGQHAQALLQKWPYLTRLFTTISPSEMTLDPIFKAWPGLDPVNSYQQATRRTTCDDKIGMILPDQREVALDATGAWPLWDSQMPWIEKMVEYQDDGQVVTLVDNKSKINSKLQSWNQSRGWGQDPAKATDSAGIFGAGCAFVTRNASPYGIGLLLGFGLLGLARRRRSSDKPRSH